MDYVYKNNITWCEPIYNQLKNINNTMKGKIKPRVCEVDVRPSVEGMQFVMPGSISINSCKSETLKDALNEVRNAILKEFPFMYNDVSFYSPGNNGVFHYYDDLIED